MTEKEIATIAKDLTVSVLNTVNTYIEDVLKYAEQVYEHMYALVKNTK